MNYRAAVRRKSEPVADMRKLLIVEDSKTFSKALRKLLAEETGLSVVTCASLNELHEVVTEEPEAYGIAVVDLNLPDAPDGEAIDFTVQRGIPTIVFTGSFDLQTRSRIMERDVIDYVLKNNEFALDTLVTAVKRALSNREMRILVVDDVTTARKHLARMLAVQQYSVIEAGSGAEALSLLEANPDIQIVVSDYNMPDINGYELTRKIRRMVGPDKLRVIGVSSTTDIAVSAGFLKAGANDFISRPFMPEELQCRIANNADTLLQLKQLQELASRDYLTGLFNRRHFFENGPKLIKTVQARPSSTVAVLDIDHFKQLNDTHGHDIGDRVLELVARCLKDAVEGTGNLLARLGGEEFVILFPGMAPAAAMRFSDHLRLDISHATLQIGAETISVTASIGVAEADPADRFDHCLRSADQALYAAKQQGRNRVCLAAT
ncbi:diguanylate cyclase (GGDEF) domain-containing protein [Bosea sp. OK403]|uniref:diguanylate cyclase n=1 Tax=Bosea sp. OK403 TaxID=1855286 RepID=UPI0008E08FEC|nr:diguanylate cyclase [Bosea sp. OK403]SFI76056.1 diguanylate cyclase (GGDEF) domain-containing protein [Bosea sp. OK403]